MRRKPPSENTTAHWSLYLLASYESDNTESPRATATELWDRSYAQDVFDTKHSLKQALRKVYDRDVPTVSDYEYSYTVRTGKTPPYAYRLTDAGKRTLQRLDTPTKSLDGSVLTSPPTELPVATYHEIGLGEPDSRGSPPPLPSTDDVDIADSTESSEGTDILPLDSDLPQKQAGDSESEPLDIDELEIDDDEMKHVFVDSTTNPRADRHIYTAQGTDGLLAPQCGFDPGVEPDTLEFTPLHVFEQAPNACDHCLQGTDLDTSTTQTEKQHSADPLTGDQLESQANRMLDAGNDKNLPTIDVEPDWRWLAISLAKIGRDDLAQRAIEQDLSPNEVYGEVLGVLYNERYTLASSTKSEAKGGD